VPLKVKWAEEACRLNSRGRTPVRLRPERAQTGSLRGRTGCSQSKKKVHQTQKKIKAQPNKWAINGKKSQTKWGAKIRMEKVDRKEPRQSDKLTARRHPPRTAHQGETEKHYPWGIEKTKKQRKQRVSKGVLLVEKKRKGRSWG